MLARFGLAARARRGRADLSRRAGAAAAGASSSRRRDLRRRPHRRRACPGCRVLCVYLRGERQATWSRRCRRAASASASRSRCSSRRREHGGLRGSLDAHAADPRAPRGAGGGVLRCSAMTSSTSRDPETRAGAQHPRFDARVFTRRASARRSRASAEPERAALGALGGEGGGLQGGAAAGSARRAFSPRASRWRSIGRARRRCAHGGAALRACASRTRGDALHAIARPREAPDATARCGAASRRLAAGADARARRRRRARALARRRASPPALGDRRRARSRSRATGRIPRLRRRRRAAATRRSRSRTTAASSPSPVALAPAPRASARVSARARRSTASRIVNRGEAAMRCIRAVKALRAHEGSRPRARSRSTPTSIATRRSCARPIARVALPPRRAARSPPISITTRCSRRCAAPAPTRSGPAGASSPRIPVFVDRVRAAGIALPRPARRTRCARSATRSPRSSSPRRPACRCSPWSGGARRRRRRRRAKRAERIGYPARGEGDGRRRRPRHPHRRRRASELADGLRVAPAPRRAPPSATAALFLERKVAGGRHIEVQIAADRTATCSRSAAATARCSAATRR